MVITCIDYNGAGHTREIVFLTDGGIYGDQEVDQRLEQHAATRGH